MDHPPWSTRGTFPQTFTEYKQALLTALACMLSEHTSFSWRLDRVDPFGRQRPDKGKWSKSGINKHFAREEGETNPASPTLSNDYVTITQRDTRNPSFAPKKRPWGIRGQTKTNSPRADIDKHFAESREKQHSKHNSQQDRSHTLTHENRDPSPQNRVW